MQDVTTTGFMRVIGRRGAPDWFVTEYFRVHETSTPEKHILDSIQNHGTARPVFAQLIGEDVPHIIRTIKLLQAYPIAGIDLNMGCPAPKVYRKNVGGGLLRDPAKIDEILSAMRAEIAGTFTVKMRIGFDGMENYESILDLINKQDAKNKTNISFGVQIQGISYRHFIDCNHGTEDIRKAIINPLESINSGFNWINEFERTKKDKNLKKYAHRILCS
jgi:hypothetical protein